MGALEIHAVDLVEARFGAVEARDAAIVAEGDVVVEEGGEVRRGGRAEWREGTCRVSAGGG